MARPLAQVNPLLLDLAASDDTLKVWGLGGGDWGFFWVQDVSLAGATVDQVRESVVVRSGATVTADRLEPGTYLFRPYDTWQGRYLAEGEAVVEKGRVIVTLPDLERDLAVELTRK